MTPLDVPLSSVPAEQLLDHVRRLKEYVRVAPDPNASGHDGQTCLSLALAWCHDQDGERLVESLLSRGADPNRPSALDNFRIFMTVSQRLPLLEKLIDAGLALNEVYTAVPGLMPTGRGGRVTLLDFALDVQAYLNGRSGKRPAKLAEKHAGPLAARHRFVADVIAMLEARGAVRAEGDSSAAGSGSISDRPR